MSYTPEPWNWMNNPYDDGTPYITIKAGPAENNITIQGIFSEDDARLICAAPALLAALQGVVAIADRDTAEFAAARAAIAAATGK